MKLPFEIHITFDRTELTGTQHVEIDRLAAEYGWHTSQIMDDPVLGPGPRLYLTCSQADVDTARGVLAAMAYSLGEALIPVRRFKIEQTIYDSEDDNEDS